MTTISSFATNSNPALQNSNVATNTVNADGLSTMFLQLLVAQIKNQNPLDPLDGTQYVSQLAEFANVESLQAMKVGLNKNTNLLESMQALEATALVGKSVDVRADTLVLEQAAAIRGAVNLGVEAQAVTVKLYNSNGVLLGEQQLAYSGVGTLRFEFPTQNSGAYLVQASATINGREQPLQTWLSGDVERVSVGASKDDIILQVNGLGNHGLLEINQLAYQG